MKQLTPIILTEKHIEPIEEEITRLLNEVLYWPLARAMEMPAEELENATTSALAAAVKAGTVWHREGHFYGAFNSKITKDLKSLGAKYNARSRTWSLTAEFLPPEIQIAQAGADARYDNLRRRLLRTLDDIRVESIDKLSTSKFRYKQAVNWMNDDFVKSVNAVTIPPRLTEDQRRIISEEWGTNLDLYIKNWAEENILKLRQQVQTNAFEGRRSEQLVKMIQTNYGTSKAKARFLARQETSLLMSKFQQTRYQDIGIKKYRWSGADDARERHDHKLLNNKVFDWNSPPVTNRKTGARNHPGEDFGCRCIAIALVE